MTDELLYGYFAQQLTSVVRALSIQSPTTYSWFGMRSSGLPRHVKRTLSPNTALSYLCYNIQARLYGNFYSSGGAVEHVMASPTSPVPEALFVDQLSQANMGKGYIQEGWKVTSLEGGCVAIAGPDIALWVAPELCVDSGEGIIPGSKLNLRLPKEMLALSPGYYMAMGDQELKPAHFSSLVRLYWNVTPVGAPLLMRDATLGLNESGVPFRLKVVSNPSGFSRRDSAVLYIRKEDYQKSKSLLGGIYARLGDELRSGSPALTKSLAPGLSLAEDPGRGESFGLHRAMLIAEGLIRAYEAGITEVSERLGCVQDRFVECGLDPDKPYLQPGSIDEYDAVRADSKANGKSRDADSHLAQVQIDSVASIPSQPSDHLKGTSARYTKDDYLRMALQIGRALCHEAIWYDEQCNWMGAMPAERRGSRWVRNYHALGPDIYSGTSGIAVFLAELWSRTGDAALRRTALGAITQALARCEAPTTTKSIGLYTGWLGIAVAAVHIGLLLNDPGLVERSRLLLRRFTSTLASPEADLLSGRAGIVVGLLMLGDLLGETSALDYASALGDDLLNTAVKSNDGYSWRASNHRFKRNLTGFAHGAAGIGYALLELYAATGKGSYRHGAEQAFKYERQWFNHEEGNWADLRFYTPYLRSRRAQAARLTYAGYWCHGAPGIALSRLRAYQLLGDSFYREEAICALATTGKLVSHAVKSDITDFSICHGAAGLGQVLLYGRDSLGGQWKDAKIAGEAFLVADKGLDQFAETDGAWPSGTSDSGQPPGLMLGTAGIGLFYLAMCKSMAFPLLFVSRRG